MAELAIAAASPVVEMVVKKLASKLWKELELVRTVRTDVQKLQSKLSTIQNVLDDAERRSITDKALRVWLRKLRDWTLDAEDVLEEFETEALRRTAERYDRITVKVCNFFSSTNPFAFRYKMGRKIKDIGESLDEIEKESKAFDLFKKPHLDRPLDRETVSLVDESEICGRDEDKNEVMKFLVDRDNDKNISILPIVGLGGVGKTTLAQLVYNDERIKKQFELRMWVFVGEIFDLKVVSRAMVEQVKRRDGHTFNLDIMLSFLQENLRTKKFLLVLDDVWIEKESEWDKLKPLFYQAKQGSKIIITTRMENIGYIIGTASLYRLQELELEDCWTIFRNRAFRFEREKENPELVEIGKEIIKKCGGLPLAAKALGSLMSTRRGKVEWQAIRDNDIWKLPLDEIGIIPTLKLSYDHLPSHLKRCFTYCSIFPKGHRFEIKSLIQLWMAEGLIDTSDTSLHAEDIGYQYFRSLLSRSFFQDVEMDKYDNIDKCKMHDLVHDLAYSLTIDESLVMKIGRENIPHGCRYLLVMCDELSSTTLKATYEAKKLRSLALLVKNFYTIINIDEFIFNIPKNFTRLHALDLSNSRIEKLTNKISKLKHLRLLDLSYTEITTLPTSITKLYNLQTLNLQGCYDLQELPEGIGNLTNLRHIDISECDGLSRMPRGLGQLQNLQTLSMFIVGQENGCTIMELKHLNSIQGELKIKDLHHVKDPNEAMQANLKAKTRLNSLILEWNKDSDTTVGPSSIDVSAEELERLQPHHNLKKLVIDGYMGNRLPRWMSSSLTNLVKLSLRGLERCAYLPPLGQLPLLQYLSMDSMDAVRRIGAEIYEDVDDFAFPSLVKLKIEEMLNLEEWEIEPTTTAERKIAIFPILIRLSIKFCPNLTMQPCIPCSVQDLEIEDSNEMLLSAGSLAGLSQLKSLDIFRCGVSSSSSSEWWDGLQYLTALDHLLIEDCEELTCLPEGIMCMPSLQDLSLVGNNNLRSLEWGGDGKKQQPAPFLTALQYLNIEAAEVLTTLPEWIGGLTSLQRLTIEECPNLAMLPDGLRRLTALQCLEISDCPKLARRCERETGEDWDKIAHIPNIRIEQEIDGSEEDGSEEEDGEGSSE